MELSSPSNSPFLFSLLSYVLREYVQSTHPSSISPARVRILRMKANLMTQRVLPKAGAHSSWQIPQLEQGLEGRCSGRTATGTGWAVNKKSQGDFISPLLASLRLGFQADMLEHRTEQTKLQEGGGVQAFHLTDWAGLSVVYTYQFVRVFFYVPGTMQ